jgi:hypothetical protein
MVHCLAQASGPGIARRRRHRIACRRRRDRLPSTARHSRARTGRHSGGGGERRQRQVQLRRDSRRRDRDLGHPLGPRESLNRRRARARDRRLRHALKRYALAARRSKDNTVQRRVGGLRPGTRYWYRLRKGRGRSELGTFVTAPRANQNATVEFGWTGDTDLIRRPARLPPSGTTAASSGR